MTKFKSLAEKRRHNTTCAHEGCETILSQYNRELYCYIHAARKRIKEDIFTHSPDHYKRKEVTDVTEID